MRSSAIGLSLFATLLSAVSFLANPGEIIRHGPMFLAAVAALPIVYVVVGYCLIPYIMRLPITSAYELLESRLGVSGRLTGAMIFLITRFVWMGMIVYLTADKVIVPLLDWPPEVTPYVCLVLTVITVAYTSMGGIRAVVLTDVIQCLILIAGAVMVIATVTVKMGGVSQWWPTHWAPNWDVQPWFSLNPHVRVTLFWTIMAALINDLTIAGSDQMAIQRYLATHDVKSARRAYLVMTCTDMCVQILLAIVGLSLLAFFLQHKMLVPPAQSVYADADGLLPYFIMHFLPRGLAGLVISALLAASMSSLSSGVNSACAVLESDFLGRFRRAEPTPSQRLWTVRVLSIVAGVVVVVLSLLIRHVPGNLFEVACKTVNLLPVPLFGLFFWRCLYDRQRDLGVSWEQSTVFPRDSWLPFGT